MRHTGVVPPLLRRALAPRTPHCHRHCDRPQRGHNLRALAPGWLCVYACPGGAVSVITYSEWSNADPTARLLPFVRAHTTPATLVRRRDLRLARRHGPELGAEAERYLARVHPPRAVSTVYWRLYPFKKKDGTVFRLFVCFRHGTERVQFFVAPGNIMSPPCPKCRVRTR